ncbi:hypothetical protein [Cohnella yongneupensis]|uniref:DUF3939 domain-containing protein n=1 Tax=Cohnella yongneupensis TaxID=425006 RepID=A0ABW0R440_9BACL
MLLKFRFLSRAVAAAMLSIALLTLSGCLYPDDQTPGGEASSRESVLAVQDAVDRFFQQTGVLPIVNADQTVPLYEKYKIDLGKLQRADYLGSVPPISFEKGGRFQFLIIDEETKPQVKLLDLVLFQTVGDVQKKVDAYRKAHGDANPAGEAVYPGFASVDFDKLNSDAPEVRSNYSHQPLDLLVDQAGQVFVDYGIDIATAITKSEAPPKADADLRRYLIDASYYVPVKSAVYHWVKDGPQAVTEHSNEAQ